MKFKEYYTTLSKREKETLADDLKTSVPYLYQLASGHRNPGRKFILNIERASFGKVTAHEICDVL